MMPSGFMIITKQGGCLMANSIVWENDIDKAVTRAKSENKPILLDFFEAG
jgi:hypothetical protein